MTDEDTRALQDTDPCVSELLGSGWRITERSFGASLTASSEVSARLASLARELDSGWAARELHAEDLDDVLALDEQTRDDYPGGVATSHAPLVAERAVSTRWRRGWGLFGDGVGLAAMTWVDLEPSGVTGEVDFTVVAAQWRGSGLGTALKATSMLRVFEAGARQVRTGGSERNQAILAANRRLGFQVDERWLTLVRQDG